MVLTIISKIMGHLLGYSEWRNFNKVIYKAQTSWEHITNNKSVRKLLLERGVKPEDLPPEEDVRKLEHRVKSEDMEFVKYKVPYKIQI